MKSFSLFVARSLLIILLLAASSVNAGPRSDYKAALENWQKVLSLYVDEEGRTDFILLARDRRLLQDYVDAVSEYGPSSHPEDFASQDDVLAYHANTYNALAMYGVIDEGIPKAFDSFFKRTGFFKFRDVRIDGRKTNLYDYENKVIRPLNEPRMHFVLNCMVKDCPRLPKYVFRAESLDEQLESATLEFINGEKYVQVNDEKRQVRVSAIFDFYTQDFVASGKARDLPDYINRYRQDPLPEGYKVKYLKYDWTINQQP